jgi:hypothetical protein
MPWQVSYSFSLTSTGQQDNVIFTSLPDRIYVVKTWVVFYSSGTLTDKISLFKTHSSVNYQFSAISALAANYPHQWVGEGWFENPDTLSLRLNCSVQPCAGVAYATGLQFIQGVGQLG